MCIRDRLNTVRELVNEAQGLTGDAFLNRAVLYRQREDLTTEVIPVDIKAIMDGTSQISSWRKTTFFIFLVSMIWKIGEML